MKIQITKGVGQHGEVVLPMELLVWFVSPSPFPDWPRGRYQVNEVGRAGRLFYGADHVRLLCTCSLTPLLVRGCSQIIGGSNLTTPLCQPISAFARSPLPPMSVDVSICPSHILLPRWSAIQRPFPLAAAGLWTAGAIVSFLSFRPVYVFFYKKKQLYFFHNL